MAEAAAIDAIGLNKQFQDRLSAAQEVNGGCLIHGFRELSSREETSINHRKIDASPIPVIAERQI